MKKGYKMIEEIRSIGTDVLTGYKVGNKHVPLSKGNADYENILKRLASGEEAVPAYTDEERVSYLNSIIVKDASDMCNSLLIRGKNFINGKNITDVQQEVYSIKVNTAKEYLASGIYEDIIIEYRDAHNNKYGTSFTNEDIANKIIELFTNAETAYRVLTSKVETIRMRINKLIIDGMRDEAKVVIGKARDIAIPITQEGIDDVFTV